MSAISSPMPPGMASSRTFRSRRSKRQVTPLILPQRAAYSFQLNVLATPRRFWPAGTFSKAFTNSPKTWNVS